MMRFLLLIGLNKHTRSFSSGATSRKLFTQTQTITLYSLFLFFFFPRIPTHARCPLGVVPVCSSECFNEFRELVLRRHLRPRPVLVRSGLLLLLLLLLLHGHLVPARSGHHLAAGASRHSGRVARSPWPDHRVPRAGDRLHPRTVNGETINAHVYVVIQLLWVNFYFYIEWLNLIMFEI